MKYTVIEATPETVINVELELGLAYEFQEELESGTIRISLQP